jgi:hypothetical protein
VSGDWQAGERVLELSARLDWVFGGIGNNSTGKSGKMIENQWRKKEMEEEEGVGGAELKKA